jgi:hypothetical protein
MRNDRVPDLAPPCPGLAFKTQARLEAEIVLLRHQLSVLRQRVPSRPKLTVADRLLFVWLYRLFPSGLDAITIVQPQTLIRWHRTGSTVLALEVALSWRSAEDTRGDPVWSKNRTGRETSQ